MTSRSHVRMLKGEREMGRRFITLFITLLTGGKKAAPASRRGITERELIERENEIGSTLFGPIPKGHHREFFCLDRDTWVWHEKWRNEAGQWCEATTRYEVQSRGVMKIVNGGHYSYIEGQELVNFEKAVQLYHQRVMREVYHREPLASKTNLAA